MPAALQYGIPYETFWKINPRIMMIYQDKKKKNLEEQTKIMDYTAWMNGVYVMRAVASCFNKSAKYPDSPMIMTKKQEPLSDTEKFKLWIAEHNRRFEEDH